MLLAPYLATEDVTGTVAPSNVASSGPFTAGNRSEDDNAAPSGFDIVTEAVSVERAAIIQFNAFVNWSSEYLGKRALSAEQWERRVVRESYEGMARFGNHKCRKTICSKQKPSRKHRKKLYRFRFWQFVQVRSKSKQLVMKRVLGRQLDVARDGQGLLPVNAIPPEVGLPALECTWPYHCKENLGILLGAPCNHDVAVLGRLPLLPAELQDHLLEGKDFKDLPSEVHGELLRELSSGIVDREFYALEYGSQNDARSVGLLQAFSETTKRYQERYPSDKTTSDFVRRRKRLMQCLSAHVNKGHHVGMPAVMSYIRGQPICYSSHSFVS